MLTCSVRIDPKWQVSLVSALEVLNAGVDTYSINKALCSTEDNFGATGEVIENPYEAR